MRNKIYHGAALLACLGFSAKGFAQSGSVSLKDGSGTVISTHSSIQGAYNALPITLTHAYQIDVANTYSGSQETFPIVFVEKSGASAANTITLFSSLTVSVGKIPGLLSTPGVLVLDGADWVKIQGLDFHARYMGASNSLLRLQNGASHISIDSCSFYSGSGAKMAISIDGAPTQAGGNSYISIKNSYIDGGLISNGTPVHPNKELSIVNNDMLGTLNAVSIIGGIGKTSILQNRISLGAGSMLGKNAVAIDLQSLSDSTFVTDNFIIAYAPGDSLLYGIKASGSATPAYLLCANNDVYLNTGILGPFTAQKMRALAIDGTERMDVDLFYNTLRGYHLDSAVANSAAMEIKAVNTGNHYRVMNNICYNEGLTTSGAGNHVAISFPVTPAGVLDIDYNTYYAQSNMVASVNGNAYNTMTGYRGALGSGKELNSNDFKVKWTNRLLDISMYNLSQLAGTPIASVTTDIEGDTRVRPYRGADEFVIKCNDTDKVHVIAYADSVCVGWNAELHVSPQILNGTWYEWQSRPAGSNAPFTTMPNTTVLQSTEYRIVDSCINGSGRKYSDTITVWVNPIAAIDHIDVSESNGEYIFTAIGAQDVDSSGYTWSFGDGNTIVTTDSSVSFKYANPGTYTVTVSIRGKKCFNIGSASVTVNVAALGISTQDKTANAVQIFPNPASAHIQVVSATVNAIQSVGVYDVRGILVYEAKSINDTKTSVPVSNFAAGQYMIRVATAQGVVTHKITVTH